MFEVRLTRALLALAVIAVTATAIAGTARAAGGRCLSEASAAQDRIDIAATRTAIEASCPCAAATSRRDYTACARGVIDAAVGANGLRSECQATVKRLDRRSTCGRPASAGFAPCLKRRAAGGDKLRCAVVKESSCTSAAGGRTRRTACPGYSHCIDAADSNGDLEITTADSGRCAVRFETIDIASAATPPNTPGTSGVSVTNPKLLAQFGGPTFDLNRARYTRFHRPSPGGAAPDAILVLIPGFEGGAGDFRVLAENLIPRSLRSDGLDLEVWGYDRRTNQLEDRAGIELAAALGDPLVALDWLFGAQIGLPLHPELAPGLNRRAEFYDPQGDIPFLASWTNLVFSRDIDAVVEAARAAAQNQNVFLGGHSAGTGFTARYAATDFNLTGVGPAEPGYAKLRGLVLLEGGGGSTAGAPLTSDTLDRIEAKFDGALFGAVRDDEAKCADGVTACTVATEATDCVGQVPAVCTPRTSAYAIVPGLLNPQILAAVEPAAIQGFSDPDGGQIILQVDQLGPNTAAVDLVPELGGLNVLPQATVFGGIGSFVDDDGFISGLASFVATSVGAPGANVGGLLTWLDASEGPLPAAALPNNGPPPTAFPPATRWGQEKEVTDLRRLLDTFVVGGTNFTDWYYPSAGPSTTSVAGVCTSGTCSVGNVGASCSSDAQCSQSVNLDSSALSIGRGRRDIENLTQAAGIDIPVIGFGGSNGLAPVPGSFLGFASSIAPCAAPSCDGTARIVNAALPSAAFPTFGSVAGGYEVHISEGYAHVDVLTAEDAAGNNVLAPLAAFLARNVQ